MGEPNPRWYGTTYGNLKWLNLYSIGTIFWAHHCIRFIQAHPGLYSHSKAKAAEWSSIFNFVFDMDGCWSALTVESWHQDFLAQHDVRPVFCQKINQLCRPPTHHPKMIPVWNHYFPDIFWANLLAAKLALYLKNMTLDWTFPFGSL